jgi:hypothetical protein
MSRPNKEYTVLGPQCSRCSNVFRYDHEDEDGSQTPLYFCCVGSHAPPNPDSNESAWEWWSRGREVCPTGCCCHYKMR